VRPEPGARYSIQPYAYRGAGWRSCNASETQPRNAQSRVPRLRRRWLAARAPACEHEPQSELRAQFRNTRLPDKRTRNDYRNIPAVIAGPADKLMGSRRADFREADSRRD